MGQISTKTDFDWQDNVEPHASRRKEILKKYPQVTSLLTPDANLKWWVLLLVSIQFGSLFILQHCSLPVLFLSAYFFNGVINHSLTLAIHEIAHNLAFGANRPVANRVLGMIANLPLGFPMSVSFRKYHLLHHKYQGDPVLDTDLPTQMEARLFNRSGLKLVWLFLQPFFYILRPLSVLPMRLTTLELVNWVVQVAADLLLVWLFDGQLWPLVYLIGSLVLCMGVHPVAGHFVSEHYMLNLGHETASYYGWLNVLTFNVGYHVEHHDFPAIPGSRLPLLKKMAPEFYDHLPCYYSWTKVLFEFVVNPDIGLYSRSKRTTATQNNSKLMRDTPVHVE